MTQPFLGQVMYVSFNFAPKGWAMCSGQTLSIQQNAALFALLGTTYGGNGQSTFALPDMRGRAPVHEGQLAGGSIYTMGEQTGAQTTSLLSNNLPLHSHSFNVSTTNGTAQEPVATIMLAHAVSDGGTMQPDIYVPSSVTPSAVNLAAQTLVSVGSSQPVSVLQPYLTVTCTMALTGVFPARN